MHVPRLSRARFLAALPLAAAAAGRAVAQPALLPIHIGAAPTDSFAEAYYARAMGFFEKAGLAAEIQSLGNGAAIAAGIASGALDVGISSVNTLANGAIHGVPFVYIAGGGMYDSNRPTIVLAVAKDSPFTDPRSFEGGSIAVTGIKDVTHLAVSAYLVQNGVDLTKVRFIEMPMPEMGPAMRRGTIAAGIIAEPTLSGASNDVRTFAKAYDAIARRMMISGWFATSDWYARNTVVAKRFISAIYETARWANRNRERSGAIITEVAKLPAATVSRMTRVTYAESLDAAMIDPTLEMAARLKFTERLVKASEVMIAG